MIFKLVSIIGSQVQSDIKQRKFDIENSHKYASLFRYNCTVNDIVCVDKARIYQKLYYKKYGTYIKNYYSLYTERGVKKIH